MKAIRFPVELVTPTHHFHPGPTYELSDELAAEVLPLGGQLLPGEPRRASVPPIDPPPVSPPSENPPVDPPVEPTDPPAESPQDWSLDVGDVTLTLDDVAGKTDQELRAIDGVGPKRLVEIREALKAAGRE